VVYIGILIIWLYVFVCCGMRLGDVETAVLSLLIHADGVLDVGSIKFELSGFYGLSGDMDVGVLRSVRSVHNSIARALRSLSSKGLIHREDWVVRLLWEGLGIAFIERTAVGKRV